MKRTTGMSLKDKLEFHSMPVTECGCWIWLGPKKYGELRIGKKMEKAHRVSWRVYRGEIPEGFYVCHACDVPACINPDHLFLGTQTDNMRDMKAKGRERKRGLSGAANSQARLKEWQVLKIREAARSSTAVAAQFGISSRTVQAIRRREIWGWL